MKSTSLLFILTFLSLILVGCDQKSVKSSNSNSSTNNYCTLYPYASGCYGSTTGTVTAGGTTGTTTNCTLQAYQPICPNYTNAYQSCYSAPSQSFCQNFCTNYPSTPACSGSTTGSSTGGSNGNTYGSLYPQGVPAGACTYSSTSGYDTDKATMTIVGGSWMNPGSGGSTYTNTSSAMKSAAAAKTFLISGTDAVMSARLKVRPQPETAGSGANGVCYGRSTGSSIPGYTKLKFNVAIASVNSPTVLETVAMDVTVGVNACSEGFNLRSFKGTYPEGYFVVISDVKSNQFCPNYNWTTGFQSCEVYRSVRTMDCWSMELEVAKDGTKTF